MVVGKGGEKIGFLFFILFYLLKSIEVGSDF